MVEAASQHLLGFGIFSFTTSVVCTVAYFLKAGQENDGMGFTADSIVRKIPNDLQSTSPGFW